MYIFTISMFLIIWSIIGLLFFIFFDTFISLDKISINKFIFAIFISGPICWFICLYALLTYFIEN